MSLRGLGLGSAVVRLTSYSVRYGFDVFFILFKIRLLYFVLDHVYHNFVDARHSSEPFIRFVICV